MKPFEQLFVLVIALGLAVACSDDAVSLEEMCENRCTTSASLGCPGERAGLEPCQTDCRSSYRSTSQGCRSQLAHYYLCTADRPVSEWLCNAEGEPVPAQGVCLSQQISLVLCTDGFK